MNCQELESNFADYCAGRLSTAEETSAELHITSCPHCRAMLDTWRMLERIPVPEPGPGLRAGFLKSLQDFAKPPRRVWFWRPAFGFGLAAATLVIGLATGWYAAQGANQQKSEIATMRGELSEMRQLVALSLLGRQSPSDRLRGIDFSMQVDKSDTEVLDALLQALNYDPNVNVRLAAVDAVARFSSSSQARKALLNAVDQQDSPLVQVAIIDQIGLWGTGEAAAGLKRIASDPGADEITRRHAETILRKLRY